jgi:5-methylcytosine-specific restriction endonuclease McrA
LVKSELYFDDGPFRIPFPEEMHRAAQEQQSNNKEARIARAREVHCPHLGDLSSRNDQIALLVEDSRYEDDDLADILAIDIPEALQIWEARLVSLFSCLEPACRTPLPIRNRTHLRRLLHLEKQFNSFVRAEDPVEFQKLATMLCEGCAQGLEHSYDEQRRADMCIRQARAAQLRKMPFEEYWLTPEWRALRDRVRIRAGKKCELCYKRRPLQVHHKTYERYGQELLTDLIALCRECHARHHNVLPEEAA